ncbi:MAG: hypothetical protein RJA44_389 [Pseudomonadota bacterium]
MSGAAGVLRAGWARLRGSIAGRLGLLFAVLALLVFGVSAALLLRFLDRTVEHERLHAQLNKVDLVAQMLQRARQRGPLGVQWPVLRAELDELQRHDRASHFRVYCLEGGQQRCDQGQAELQAVEPGRAREVDGALLGLRPPPDQGAVRVRLISRDLPGLAEDARIRIVVGSDDSRARHALSEFVGWIALISLAGALTTAVLGAALASWALRPVRLLSESAATLGPGHWGLRLQTPAGASELHALVTALNGALDRLQEAFEQLETFNANVAHELRTPLTALIGSAQVALARPRSADELREALAGNLEDAERLAAMVRDMLFLARADHGARAEALQPRSWRALAEETAEFFEPLLEDEGRTLVIQGEAESAVEPGLFKRALSNLIANALQYGEAGTPIEVHISREADQLCLEVRNHGPALPEATCKRMFDRFYRADPARARQGGHAGLGLAIVKAIAQMHGGTVHAASSEGRVQVGWRWPQDAEALLA